MNRMKDSMQECKKCMPMIDRSKDTKTKKTRQERRDAKSDEERREIVMRDGHEKLEKWTSSHEEPKIDLPFEHNIRHGWWRRRAATTENALANKRHQRELGWRGIMLGKRALWLALLVMVFYHAKAW